MSEPCQPRIEGTVFTPFENRPPHTVWTLECDHFTAVGEWGDLIALANVHTRQAYARRLLGTLNTEHRAPPWQGSRLARRGGLLPRSTTAELVRELLELVASQLIYRAACARDNLDAATARISRRNSGDQ